MLKVIIWIVLIFAVLFALRLVNVAAARRARGRSQATGDGAARPADAMVRCSRCGVFLPQAEAKRIGGRYVCGDKACLERH